MKTKDPISLAKVGEVVITDSDYQNKVKQTLGIIIDAFPGPDGTVGAIQVKISKFYLERAMKHLYPLELSCNIMRNIDSKTNKIIEAADKS